LLVPGEAASEILHGQLSATSVEPVRVDPRWQGFLRLALERHRTLSVAPHLDPDAVPVFQVAPTGMEAFDWEFGLDLLVGASFRPVRSTPESVFMPPLDPHIDVLVTEDLRHELAILESSSWHVAAKSVEEKALLIESTPLTWLSGAVQGFKRELAMWSGLSKPHARRARTRHQLALSQPQPSLACRRRQCPLVG
jgi:hypothetical protein